MTTMHHHPLHHHPHHPQHHPHQRRRRSVTFSETSQQILVRDLSNTSEKDTLWYSSGSEDLTASKANLLYCKDKVRESISNRLTPSASSILGVEKYLTEQLTNEYMNRRHMLRKRVDGKR